MSFFQQEGDLHKFHTCSLKATRWLKILILINIHSDQSLTIRYTDSSVGTAQYKATCRRTQ